MLLGSGHAEWCRVDDEVSGDVSALFPRSAQQTEFVAEGFRALFPAVGEGNIGEAARETPPAPSTSTRVSGGNERFRSGAVNPITSVFSPQIFSPSR